MGVAKATLSIGDESMLGRVVRLLSAAVSPIVVVAAPEQELPQLPAEVSVVYDEYPGCGPLGGLHAGLTAVASRAEIAYLTGCDAPLLAPDFVRRIVGLLGNSDVAVPVDGQHYHSLAAVYRMAVLPEVTRLLNESTYRMTELFKRVETRRVNLDELQQSDPGLATLTNVNRQADYLAILRELEKSP